MRTKACLFSFTIIIVSLLKAQTPLSFRHNADSVFQHLNKSGITTGILYDRVYPFAMLHLFNTKAPDTSNAHHFRQGYYELYNAKYSNADLISPHEIRTRIEAIAAKGRVPVGILNFTFNQIDTNALADNLLKDEQGIFYDVPNRTRSAYQEKEVSIISTLTDRAEGLQVTFETSPGLFLRNTKHTITSLQADFDNGSGLANIGLNNTITINYPSYGKKIIKFIVTYNDNTQVTTYASFKLVKPEEFPLSKGTPCDKDDYITAAIPFTDYENNTFKGQGNLRYYFSTKKPCDGKVRKPVIILDGFDPGDTRSIKQLYHQYLNNKERYSFADSIRSKGYDIVILNFPTYVNELGNTVDGGADYIERNAFVLIKLIQKLNKELKENNSPAKLVIIGPSMGGMISRYALAYMEKNNMPHNTRLWISLDAPHNGANIPIGAQKYLEFFAGNGVESAEETLQEKLNNPAAKQQLLHHYLSYSDLAMGAPGFRDKFIQSITNNGVPGSNGFPVLPRKVALVNGSLSGALQPNTAACEIALNSKTYFSIGRTFLAKVQALKIAEGSIYMSGSYGNSCLVLSAEQLFEGDVHPQGYAPATTVSYDIAPGGSRNSFAELAGYGEGFTSLLDLIFFSFGTETNFTVYDSSHAFIPTKSALAFRGTNQDLAESVYDRNLVCTGETPFDTYYGGTVNTEHSVIDSAMAVFGIDEITHIRREPTYANSLPSLSISGPDKFCVPGGVYSLAGSVSKGTDFTWSVSSPIANISVNKLTQKAELTRISNGTAILNLTLSNACGLNQTLTKTFSIGGYSSGDYPVTGPSTACKNNYVTYTTKTLPGGTYNWFYPGDWTYVDGNNTPMLTLITGNTEGSRQVGVRVANACDAGGSPSIVNTYVNNCGGFSFKATPNPSHGEVFVATEQSYSKQNASTGKIYQLEVRDMYGTVKRKLSYTHGINNVNLNLGDLINGIYFLHVFNGKEWSYRQIVVAH